MSDTKLWLIERCDGKEISIHQSYNQAAIRASGFDGGKADWYDVVPVSPLALLDWSPRLKSTGWEKYGDDWVNHE